MTIGMVERRAHQMGRATSATIPRTVMVIQKIFRCMIDSSARCGGEGGYVGVRRSRSDARYQETRCQEIGARRPRRAEQTSSIWSSVKPTKKGRARAREATDSV